jgi:hypothetical protein
MYNSARHRSNSIVCCVLIPPCLVSPQPSHVEGQSRRGDLHRLFVAFSHTSAARRTLLWCSCGPCAKRLWHWHDADGSQSIDCITIAPMTVKRHCARTAASCTSDTQVSKPAKPFAQPWDSAPFSRNLAVASRTSGERTGWTVVLYDDRRHIC